METLGDLFPHLEGPFKEKAVNGFEVDSRKVREGGVFFALEGAKVDGHDYLEEVARKKALAAVVSTQYEKDVSGLPLIHVEDVLATLQKMAALKLSSKSGKVIAVTGSMGKTTTKEFLATLLEAKYSVFKTPGNANSQIGLPLSVLNADLEEEVLIFEMGMMAEGQIRKLMKIAPPDVAVITKIAPAHLEFFQEGLSGIARAKSEILEDPRTSFAVINSSASIYHQVTNKGSCSKVYYAQEKKVGELNDFTMEIKDGSVRVVSKHDTSPWMELPFDAPHLKENFLAATIVARYLGVTWESIAQRAAVLRLFKNRFEKIERNGVIFINDTYNANPESMKAALANLPKPRQGAKTYAVLGHMVELGALSNEIHAEIGERAGVHVDHLLCVGEIARPLFESFARSGKPAQHYLEFNELKKAVFETVQAGDVVLVKASNSAQLWRLFE